MSFLLRDLKIFLAIGVFELVRFEFILGQFINQSLGQLYFRGPPLIYWRRDRFRRQNGSHSRSALYEASTLRGMGESEQDVSLPRNTNFANAARWLLIIAAF